MLFHSTRLLLSYQSSSPQNLKIKSKIRNKEHTLLILNTFFYDQKHWGILGIRGASYRFSGTGTAHAWLTDCYPFPTSDAAR